MNKILFFMLFLFSLLIFQNKAIAQKTDTIYHINGNVLTGDFKNLKYGVVTWKMDGMGTISFEEVKINTIISDKQFEIKMKDDLIYFGSFAASKTNRTVYILMADDKKLINIEDILEVYPIKRNFWMRTSGDLSLGLNYSKGSAVTTLSFSGNLDYRKKKSYYKIAWDSNNTFQSDTVSSTKSDLTFSWQRLFKKGWSTQSVLGGSQNLELGTKLRWELDLMGIKDIAYNSWNRLYFGAGLSAIRETPYGNSGSQEDLSAIFQVAWKVFKYTSPKIWVDANISYLPYFTDNRSRTVFNLNPQISVLSDDFKVGVSFYYNYDSNPSENANSSEDYGLNLQLSYSFH
ncbi:MAG: DUF481 domain-containing protein [Eudoraea sp.]